MREQSTFFPGVGPVKKTATQTKAKHGRLGYKVKEAGYSSNMQGALMNFDRHTQLPKTSQIFSTLTDAMTSSQSFQHWPEWGTMQNGELAMLQILVPHIKEVGFSLLLTPTASDYKRVNLSSNMFKRRKMQRNSPGTLAEQIAWLGHGGTLNPLFYAYMMGFPLNWTLTPFQNQVGGTEP